MKNLLMFLLLIVTQNSFAQNKWSLEDCVLYTLENNFSLVHQSNENLKYKEDILAAKGNYYPDLTFNGSQGFSLGNSFNVSTGVGQRESKFNSFGISSSLLISSGLVNKYKLRKAKLIHKKGEFDKDLLITNIAIEVTEKYLKVLFAKEILKINKKQIAISEREVDRVTNLHKLGLESKKKLLNLKSALLKDNNERTKSENNILLYKLELKELLGLSGTDFFDIVAYDDINVFSFRQKDASLIDNPNYNSAYTQQLIKTNDMKIAKSEFYPRITLNYTYGTNYFGILGEKDVIFNTDTSSLVDNGFLIQLDNNRTHFISLNLNLPIFNRFRSKVNYQKAKLELEQSDNELNKIKLELENTIIKLNSEINSAKLIMEANKVDLGLKEEIFKVSNSKFQKGLINDFEFLSDKSSLNDAYFEYINSKYAYIFKIKIFEFIMGKRI